MLGALNPFATSCARYYQSYLFLLLPNSTLTVQLVCRRVCPLSATRGVSRDTRVYCRSNCTVTGFFTPSAVQRSLLAQAGPTSR